MVAKFLRGIQGVLGTRIEGVIWLVLGVYATMSIGDILNAPRTPFPHQGLVIFVRCTLPSLIAILCLGIFGRQIFRGWWSGKKLGPVDQLRDSTLSNVLFSTLVGAYLSATFLSILYEEKWRGGKQVGASKWLILGVAIFLFCMAGWLYKRWRREKKGIDAREERACSSTQSAIGWKSSS